MASKQGKRTSEKKSSVVKRLFTGRTKSKKHLKTEKSTISDDSDAYSQADVSIYANKTLNTARESPTASLLKYIEEEHAEVATSYTPSLQLVLLLMDPSSRRFELLQLEFDSGKAKVSDIMAQIPVSVTEDVIRKQKYSGVVNAQATHMGGSARLADFCSKKEVLVALPQDLSVRDCVRLARPILSDDKVVSMLGASGFDISTWIKKVEEHKKDEEHKTRDLPTAEGSVGKTDQMSVSIFPLVAILALIFIMIQAAHNHVAAPIQVGRPLAPGTWRSKCGLMSFLPSCTNSYLQVNDDGTATIYDANQLLDYSLVGSVCTKPDCVEGLVLGKDGKISIGGKIVKKIAYFDQASDLTPWPFADKPKAKMKRFSSSETAHISKHQRMQK